MEGLKSYECSDCRQPAIYWCVDCLAYWCEEGSLKFHAGGNTKGHKVVPPLKKAESMYDKWKDLNSTLIPQFEETLKELDHAKITIEMDSKQVKQNMNLSFTVLMQRLQKKKEEL